MNATPARRQRVPALSAEDRRAKLIEATIPLLREYGATVTTRQIADAAGVAEGTIFGVFPDKMSLIRAAVVAVMDTTPVVVAMRGIDPGTDLRERLVFVVELLQNRVALNGPLMNIVRVAAMGSVGWPPPELLRAREDMLVEIVKVIEPDRDRLRQPPEVVARLVQAMVVTSARGFFGEPDILDARDLVSLLLDGLWKDPVAPLPPEPKDPNSDGPDLGVVAC